MVDSTLFKPKNVDELIDAVLWAGTSLTPIEICGQGTKRALGNQTRAKAIVNLSALSGIIDYNAQDRLLRVRAATPLAEIEEKVSADNLALPFDLPDWGPLFGKELGQASLIGALSTHLSGDDSRFAQDLPRGILQIECINGVGEVIKAGRGDDETIPDIDLISEICGCFGTLCPVTELTLGLVPQPDYHCTFILCGLEEKEALWCLSMAAREIADVTSCAFLPAALAGRGSVEMVQGIEYSLMAFRLQGRKSSVTRSLQKLYGRLPRLDRSLMLYEDDCRVFWQDIKNVSCFFNPNTHLWRLSIPSSHASAMAQVLPALPYVDYFYNHAGSQIWCAIDGKNPRYKLFEAIISKIGGVACLVRAGSIGVKKQSVFLPIAQALPDSYLHAKDVLDPLSIFNLGRLYREG